MDEQFARQHTPAQPGPYVMLAMTDTGCGMNAEIQSRIFEPFFTTKELGKGTGLGLSTVYGVVKQSSGFIWVYSEPGRGTTFKIYLPLADELVEPELPSEKDSGAYPGSETILVVEDDAELRILTHRSLEELGYTILETGPTEAIRISERYEGAIHLMVTDVVMPGMSGRELADRLIVPRPEMKVLYVSGHTDDTIVHHGMLEPGLAFLQKPFSPRALARKVREVLAARPKADENATEGRISTVIDLK
jgi:CheY-like chemotaxis protein